MPKRDPFNNPSVQKNLEKFREKFEKEFGQETLRRGLRIKDYQVISTGSVELDVQLGVGGYVEGRIYEWWGPPDFGKSTFAALACIEAQRKYPDRLAVYIDAENKVDEAWFQSLGLDLNRWWLIKPNTAEEVSDMVKMVLDDPLHSIVVVDSIGALISKAESEKQADEAVVANVAKIVTRMTKIATLGAPKTGAVVLIINQPRDQINSRFANITTPGGWALKMATTAKLRVGSSDKKDIAATVRGERIPIGQEISVKIERNKLSPRGQTVRVFLKNVATDAYGPVGIDTTEEALSVALKLGFVKPRGSQYDNPYTGEAFRGREKFLEYLRDHPDEVARLRADCVKLTAPADIEDGSVDIPDEPPEDAESLEEIEEQAPDQAPEGEALSDISNAEVQAESVGGTVSAPQGPALPHFAGVEE